VAKDVNLQSDSFKKLRLMGELEPVQLKAHPEARKKVSGRAGGATEKKYFPISTNPCDRGGGNVKSKGNPTEILKAQKRKIAQTRKVTRGKWEIPEKPASILKAVLENTEEGGRHKVQF